jgi:hypothetical protein
MGGGIVLGAYWRPDLAYRHARCVTGANVVSLDLDAIRPDLRSCIEVLDALPPEIDADINVDWEQDDDLTPEVVAVEVDDIDDG